MRVLGALTLAVLLALAFTPVVGFLEDALAPPYPASTGGADVVVVLGASVSPDGVLSDNSLRRVVEGIALAREGRAPLLFIHGARNAFGADESVQRAALARRLGLEEGRLLVEHRGHTTHGEARVARERLGAGRHVLLVTGRYHMPRAVRMFEQAGFSVTPAPVVEVSGGSPRPDERLRAARALLTEVVARTYNRLAGQL